jgi:molybdopterin converting factor small subunit
MITVSVRWFAAFREATGVSTEPVTSVAVCPADLFEEMKTRHQGLGDRGAALVAINDEISDWDTQLQDGDEILFFPPVAGG